MYKSIIRPLLFQFDPESIHHLFLDAAQIFKFKAAHSALNALYKFEDAKLSNNVFGLDFANPIGLAAGFDKNCEAMDFFSALGFGFAEVGTVTAKPQSGNPRPRIVRLAQDRALINRMGFPSQGADKVAQNLIKLSAEARKVRLGVNIGKTKVVALDDALEDYLQSFSTLYALGDFFILNVSSPNTPELRKLQERPRLEALFRGIQNANSENKPILVKIAPDLSLQEIDDILGCCLDCNISGIVATNTTFSRDGLTQEVSEQGGLSGAPLFSRSLEVVKYIFKHSQGKLPIIAVGGIYNCEQVVAMIRSGASLVQIYTSLIYEGPSQVKRLKKELIKYMDMHGVANVKHLVGTA